MSVMYPRLDANPAEVFSAETLARLTAYLFSWKQGPGEFGGLHLHPCWLESSVLQRRYQGQTTWTSVVMMRAARFVPGLADEIVSNLLGLQTPEGGFIHADYQNEPALTPYQTCPIHQALPILALLEQAGGPRRDEIRAAVDRHWAWFNGYGWKRGKFFRPEETAERHDRPGWCGVTNQDLTVVAALARYGKVFGDFRPYEQFGKPTLDAYLGPDFYYEKRGLFERGDRPDFTERTFYYDIILDMLEVIHESTGDERLPGVMANVTHHLRDAVFIAPDGLAYLAYGAAPDGGWIRTPISFAALPALIPHLRRQGVRSDDLERTLAAYTFADGTIPSTLETDPLFAIVPNAANMWRFLVETVPVENLATATATTKAPIVHRQCGDWVWKNSARFWSIKRNGERLFAGIKADPTGIAIGAETLPGLELDELEQADVNEVVPQI